MAIDKILTSEQIDKLNEKELKEYISKYNKEIARRLVEIQTQLQEEDKELAQIGTDFLTKNHEIDNLRSQLKLLAETLRQDRSTVEGLKRYKAKYIEYTKNSLIAFGVDSLVDFKTIPDSAFWKLRNFFDDLLRQGYESHDAYMDTFLDPEVVDEAINNAIAVMMEEQNGKE